MEASVPERNEREDGRGAARGAGESSLRALSVSVKTLVFTLE